MRFSVYALASTALVAAVAYQAYEARRQKILEAAEGRDAANKNRGLNPRAAQKLRATQSAPLRDEFQSKKDQQIVNDWNS